MSEDNDWLKSRPTGHGGWFIVISGGDASDPEVPRESLMIPRTMVLLTTDQFADLVYRAGRTTISTPDGTTAT